jgi:hypothetical protein
VFVTACRSSGRVEILAALDLSEETLEAVAKRYAKHNPRGRSRADGLGGESKLHRPEAPFRLA